MPWIQILAQALSSAVAHAEPSLLVAVSLAGVKMATNFLVHEKIWFDTFKYDDAERKFYEQMNGSVAGSSRQENGASVILRDITRARENIQKSLAGSSGPGASSGPGGDLSELVIRIASLEVENQSLRGVAQDLQQAVSKLEAWLSALEKSSPAHPATVPQTQHMSPVRQVETPQGRRPPSQRTTRTMTLTCSAAMRRRTRRLPGCGRRGCGSTLRRRSRRLPWWPSPPFSWTSSLGMTRWTWPSWRPACAPSSWMG